MSLRIGGSLFAICLCLLGINAHSASQWLEGESYFRWDHWTVEQGLPQNTVNGFTQTRDGYLWIATRFGLARFDGLHFTSFKKADIPVMKSDACLSLAEDAEGWLWIGTDDGLLSFYRNEFRAYSLVEGSAQERIWSVVHVPESGIWIGHDHGLSHYDGSTFHHYSIPDSDQSQVQSVSAYPNGKLFIRVAHLGYFWFDRGTKTFEFAEVRGGPPQRWEFAHPSKTLDTHWIVASNQLHIVNSLHHCDVVDRDRGLPRDWIDVLFDDEQGGLWLASRTEGLFHFENEAFKRFDIGNEPHNRKVNTVFKDSENNIWIGTDGDGIFRVQRRSLAAYSTRQGVEHPQVWSVWPKADGGVWIGSREGINSITDGVVTSFRGRPNSRMEKVRSVYQATDGTAWFGSHSEGLKVYRDGNFMPPPTDDLRELVDIRVIYQDNEDNVWIGHNEGLYRYGKEPKNFSKENGLASHDVRVLLQDRDGSLWIGTYKDGLCHLKDGRITRENLPDNHVWALYQDEEDVLWIGTENGLIRKDGTEEFVLRTEQGLKETLINQILEDDQGRFWLSGLQGIYHVQREDLNNVAHGITEAARTVEFGIADGMLSSETNGEQQPAGCKDPQGNLWFPTTKGVVKIDPRKIKEDKRSPSLIIEQVEVDQEQFLKPDAASQIVLPPGRAQVVAIRYTAISLTAPTKVTVKYRLRGHHDDWRFTQSSRIAYYTNLRPGKYRFEIAAANHHGHWTRDFTTFGLTLKPHFYQLPIFYVGCLLGIIGLILFALQKRIQFLSRLHRLEQQHAVHEERSRIAQDLHDELGSSFTRIALLSELATQDQGSSPQSKSHLKTISNVTTGLFNSLDELIWAADPKHDSLDGLVSHISKYARDYLSAGSIRCRLEIPEKLHPHPLPAETRHHLLLVVKEALANVLTHSKASEVWIRLTVEGSFLTVSIEDNGIGIGSGPSTTSHTGNGIPNMRSRIEELGGRLRLENREEGGTALRITLDIH